MRRRRRPDPIPCPAAGDGFHPIRRAPTQAIRGVLTWLRTEASGGQAFAIVLYALVLLSSVDFIEHLVITSHDQNLVRNAQWASSFPHSPAGYFYVLVALTYYAGVEEILTRAIPLTLVTRLTTMPLAVIVVSVLSSAIFGYLHGGAAYIWSRGVAGLIYCGVFLKCGGWSRGWRWSRPFKALFFSTLTHFLHNALVATPIFWGWRTV
jgi:hypothetical protein